MQKPIREFLYQNLHEIPIFGRMRLEIDTSVQVIFVLNQLDKCTL